MSEKRKIMKIDKKFPSLKSDLTSDLWIYIEIESKAALKWRLNRSSLSSQLAPTMEGFLESQHEKPGMQVSFNNLR